MSTLVNNLETGENELLVKGAPESILDRCNYIQLRNDKIVKLTAKYRKMILIKH